MGEALHEAEILDLVLSQQFPYGQPKNKLVVRGEPNYSFYEFFFAQRAL